MYFRILTDPLGPDGPGRWRFHPDRAVDIDLDGHEVGRRYDGPIKDSLREPLNLA